MNSITLPYPEALPTRRSDLAMAAKAVIIGADVLPSLHTPAARAALRARLSPYTAAPAAPAPATQRAPRRLAASSRQAQAEQREHDRYFEVERSAGPGADAFVAGLVLAHLAVYESCEQMGVTLLDGPQWDLLCGGLGALIDLAGPTPAAEPAWAVAPPAAAESAAGQPPSWVPGLPSSAGYRAGYDPAKRWLAGHQLFFSLIQGAIVGLNCFATAVAAGQPEEADLGLRLAAAFLHSSAEAMKLASDFAPADYDQTVRPAMVPPKVRAGFSGLQTRDHAYLVRLFAALKPLFPGPHRSSATRAEFTEAVVLAYAAHEFICARFRGDVLPSLRMAAASRGHTQRSGTEVIREMMRARLHWRSVECRVASVIFGAGARIL